MIAKLVLGGVVSLALAGCIASAEEPEAAPVDDRTLVTVTGFECGDNCYVTLRSADTGVERSVLCLAEPCRDWNAATEMPPEDIGRQYLARFGTGQQVDADGGVMDPAYPAVITMEPV
jgi:hypothetical protein